MYPRFVLKGYLHLDCVMDTTATWGLLLYKLRNYGVSLSMAIGGMAMHVSETGLIGMAEGLEMEPGRPAH